MGNPRSVQDSHNAFYFRPAKLGDQLAERFYRPVLPCLNRQRGEARINQLCRLLVRTCSDEKIRVRPIWAVWMSRVAVARYEVDMHLKLSE